MTPLELSEKEFVILERVKKLLAIANDERGNEHQAAAAAAKAQELLDQYNLDSAMVGQAESTKRGETRFAGGLYKWQRSLWESVAALNFCMYWSIKGTYKGSKYQHRVLGKRHNVVGAQVMADYLQQTVERLAQEEAHKREINVFKREMIAYREGMAERLCERLWALRRERLEEERRKAREAQERARTTGESTGTAVVTLANLESEERDLNLDHLYGLEPGTTARRRAESIARAKQREEEFEQWKRENPEEWAEMEAKRRKEYEETLKRERRRYSRPRRMTAEEKRRQMREFDQGYVKGDDISLAQQVKKGSPTKKLN